MKLRHVDGSWRTPGLLFFHQARAEAGVPLPRVGPFHALGHGPLFTQASNEHYAVFLEGLLFDAHTRSESDAEHVLALAGTGRLDETHDLNGFYNLVLIDKHAGVAQLSSDRASSRPWYLYEGHGLIGAAPSPLMFRELGLPMTWNRQAMYESVRLLHPGGNRTLIEEIQRVQPGVGLSVRADGTGQRFHFVDWRYEPAGGRGLDDLAAEIKDLVAESIRGVVRHPLLRERSLEVSLTGGMDSRHILGELLAQGHRPARIRHVVINDTEREPVEAICSGLDLPLKLCPAAEMDHSRLFDRWLTHSGGLVNLHQYYLLHMMEDLPPRGVVGFDGYLMDWVLGSYTKDELRGLSAPVDRIWNRLSIMPQTLSLTFADAKKLSERGKEEARADTRRFEGPPWFQLLMLDFHRRGLHYTGGAFPLMGPDAEYFAPGACPRSLEFLMHADHQVGGNKRARLRAMQHYFPTLSHFPSSYGAPFDAYRQLRKTPASPMRYVKPWPRSLTSGFRHDPAPQTEHEWLRRPGPIKTLHKRIVDDSALAEDGHWRRRGLAFSWRIHQMGGYEAWALFSLASVEIAYRLLVRGQSPESLHDWLFTA